MTEFEIDRLLGQTPCICGATNTWHGECYAGKTEEQITTAYRRVYAKLRAKFAKQRKDAVAAMLKSEFR